MLGDLETLVNRRVAALPNGLRKHIYRVRDIAANLAECHSIDPQLAALAMLAHDVARAMPGRQLLDRAEQLEVPVTPLERSLPILLHGPVGARILKREDGLTDESMYQAVYWHTTAHPSLDPLGKLVFLADKLDPQKSAAYPYLPELMELAVQDLDLGVLEFASREIIARTQRGEMVHPVLVETRNALLVGAVRQP